MIRKLQVLFLIVVALCIGARGQDQKETGTISGRVVTDTGQPLAGATLFIRAMNSVNSSRSTTSDADGNFRVNGLEPGLYTIVANAPAYATDPVSMMAYYRLGDTVRLELIRGGVVTGTVTSSSGEPVVGVRVRALRIRDVQGQTPRLPSFSFQEQSTDDRGIYRIYGLLPGTYLVSAGGGGRFSSNTFNPFENDAPTFAPSSTRDDAAEISVRAGEESSADIRYRGESGYGISGTVKATGASGVSVTVKAAGSSAPLAGTFQLPGARGFAFNGLTDGEYVLRAQEVLSGQQTAIPLLASSPAKRVTIKGASVTGVELVTMPMTSIGGRIVLEPSKIAECQGKRPPLFAEMLVQLHQQVKEPNDDEQLYAGLIGGAASPDGKGALLWRNVMPGRYRFEPRFYAHYWYLQSITINTTGPKPQKIDAAANWTVARSGEQITSLTITLAEGAASIHGRLPLAEGATVQPGTIFYLVPAEPDKATDVLRFFMTDVGADGTFTVNSIPPGKYWALLQTNVDPPVATLAKLREPETEAATARAKLRRTAEAKKTEIELKPCQNLADYQMK